MRYIRKLENQVMPVKDKYHDIVVKALEKDGWEVTHDHYFLPVGSRKSYVDVAAEKPISAVKGTEKILVEIKSFIGRSEMTELQKALGQFNLYVVALEDLEPERTLFLAVPDPTYRDLFAEPIIQKVIKRSEVKLLTFDIETETIVQWIK